jgi:glycosyltransferase involved in cell wall biosynthesis
MKIFCMCLTKNEADIIRECLKEASEWADRIFVYDGESTDGTWEIVNEMSNDCIVPWKRDGKVFREGLRAEIFERFRHESSEEDWWCELNADEFYVEDPRSFLKKVTDGYHVVWATAIQYYLTYQDVQEYDFVGQFSEDREKIRYYKANSAERRFFRYRERLTWKLNDAWPKHLGLVYPEKLRFRHFHLRSPQQIQTRLDVRRDNRERGFEGWDHAKEEDWREKLRSREELNYDQKGEELVVDENLIPDHLEPKWQRAVKRVLHGTGIWP